MEEKTSLSVCEEMIMSILWDDDEDLDLQQVTERINAKYNREWKIQTVATFLTRLQKKSYISIYRVDRYSHYRPEVRLYDYRKQKLEEMKITLLFDNRVSMANFIKHM